MAAYDMVGQIALFAGAYTPRGWKRCDGSVLNIVEYRALFDIIGDTYGGNGTTTFALPNLGGRYMVCAQGVRPNLRPEAWSEILPPGVDSPDSGALGTGFTSGGGAGAIPDETNITIGNTYFDNTGKSIYFQGGTTIFQTAPSSLIIGPNNISFYNEDGGTGEITSFDANTEYMAFFRKNAAGEDFVLNFQDGAVFTDNRTTPIGFEYAADYSATIAANPRSIPDVGTVELISGRIYRATATLNFGSTAAGQSSDLTVAVTGASVGDPVSVGLPAAPDANSCFTAWVSAADTVTVRFNNYSAGAIDPASGSYKVIVTKY